MVIETAWEHDFRLEFGSGDALAGWLQTSGIATSSALPEISNAAVQALWRSFAERLEAFREGDVVPLDFHLAGVVASLPELSGTA
jgi:hypothetical protein